jgi:hypothetical protein
LAGSIDESDALNLPSVLTTRQATGNARERKDKTMGPILLWLIGIPIPIIILLMLFMH